jgi:hypothetical protein
VIWQESRLYAVNVAPNEGDLTLVDREYVEKGLPSQ